VLIEETQRGQDIVNMSSFRLRPRLMRRLCRGTGLLVIEMCVSRYKEASRYRGTAVA
jgi:hypothetical protein